MRERDQTLSLRISRPDNIWGRAGLHTGDRVVAVNGVAVRTWPELRAQPVRLRMGDRGRVDVERPSGPFSAEVRVTGYEQPVVVIEAAADPAEKARRLLAAWPRRVDDRSDVRRALMGALSDTRFRFI